MCGHGRRHRVNGFKFPKMCDVDGNTTGGEEQPAPPSFSGAARLVLSIMASGIFATLMHATVA